MSEWKRLTAVVYGRVQGVSFRYYTQREAARLGVVGWVANQRDGSVRTVAEAPEALLTQFLQFLHRGPVMAQVSRVDAQWAPAENDFAGFQVRYLS